MMNMRPFQRLMQMHLLQADVGYGSSLPEVPEVPEVGNSIGNGMPAAAEQSSQPQSTPVPPTIINGNTLSIEDATESQINPGDGELGNVMDTTYVTTPEPVVDPSPSISTGVIIGICVLAVVLVAAVVVVLLRGKKKKLQAAEDDIVPIEGEDEPISGIVVGAAQNIGKRSEQQDAFRVADVPNGGMLAVVADGMGGMANGAAISQMAVNTIISGFRKLPVYSSPALYLTRLAYSAHQAICSMPSAGTGGSTLLMAYIINNSLFTLTVGDSRIYLMRDHMIMQLNREHTYAVDLDEKAARGEISMEEALKDPQRKALTSYLGIDDLTTFDRIVQPITLKDGDKIALMSDGVFGTVSDEELQALLELPAQQAVKEIEQAVMGKDVPRQDNMTVVVVEYHA